jgi:hypothetical protein
MHRSVAPFFVLVAFIPACEPAPPTSPPAGSGTFGHVQAAQLAAGVRLERDLASLRSATARYHRIEEAHLAGYDTQFPPGCFSSAGGAMGYHFLSPDRVGTLSVTEPQLLMYEPQKNGRLRLVGVEYIVPGSPDDEPPALFGRPFHYNAVFGVWALHVWAWAHNPNGTFADWNPTVSCEHAATVADLAH